MHILLVDDNEQFRAVTAEMLARAGHSVRTSGSGNDALRCLRDSPADLVITDIVMPGQDGIELMIQLRKEFPRLALIAISGGSPNSELYLRIATKLGAATTLLKPFSEDELLVAIARLELNRPGSGGAERSPPKATR